MNWSAGILIMIGVMILIIGFSGSQVSVCQAIFGGKCAWLPGTENLTPEQKKSGGPSGTPVGVVPTDQQLSNIANA